MTKLSINNSNYRSIHAAVPSYYQIWDFGDSTPIVKANYPTHTYTNDGTYTVTLKIYDIKGGFQQIQKTLVVNSNQSAPASAFYADNTNTTVNTTINFVTMNQSLVSPTSTARWNFGDGTVKTGLHSNLLTVSHSYSQKGLYPVDLMVTDEFGKSSYYTVYVNIQDTNRPINAVIKLSAHTGKIPFPVRFDASESTSATGNIAAYNWQIWSPSATYFNQNKTWTANYTTGGERFVNLYIEDDQGNSGYAWDVISPVDPAQIPPTNQNPIANIKMDFTQTGNTSIINLSGWNSSDPDGDRIVSYDWIFDGSPVSSDANFTLTSNGNYDHLLALRVTDRWGAVGETKVSFKNPNVSFDFAPVRPITTEPVYFTADEQTLTLPNSQAASYAWDFGDGSPIQYAQTVSHTFANAGTYNVKVTVTDNLQRTYQKVRQVTTYTSGSLNLVITGKNADNTRSAKSGELYNALYFPETINFDLSESIVFGEGIVSANWDFGDGNTGFGLNPSYTYQKPGSYTVSVSATDSQNITSTATLQILVNDWGCTNSDGIDGCLQLVNSNGNVLPMSLSEWTIHQDKSTSLT